MTGNTLMQTAESCPFRLQTFGGLVRHPSCHPLEGLSMSVYRILFLGGVQIFPEKLFSTSGDTPLVSNILSAEV